MKLSSIVKIVSNSIILSTVLTPNTGYTTALSEGSSATALPSNVNVISQNVNQVEITTVYLIQDGVRTEMQKRAVSISGGTDLFTYRVRAVLSGEEANIRLITPQPEFQVFIPSDLYAPDFIYIAELRQKRGRRQVSIERISSLGGSASSGIRDRDRVPVDIKELRKVKTEDGNYTQYGITPVEPLESGEYALMISNSTLTPGTLTPSTASDSFYDFGVD